MLSLPVTSNHQHEVGFTLIEMMVVLLILAISTSLLALALPDSSAQKVEHEAQRLRWVVDEAHAEAQRYRQPMTLELTPSGYILGNVPVALRNEEWALPHASAVSIARMDTNNTYTIFDQPIPAYAQWRVQDGSSSRDISP